jgi:hypothetical protein
MKLGLGLTRRTLLAIASMLLWSAPALSAQAPRLKLCIWQDDEGYDALRLSRALSSQYLESGVSLSVVAITAKVLSADEERRLADSAIPFIRVLLTEKSAKERATHIEQLGCEYEIKMFFHESIEMANSGQFGQAPGEDRTTVGYELRKAASKKLLQRSSLPPRTVYTRQGHRVFDPYALFAGQIVKKLDALSK